MQRTLRRSCCCPQAAAAGLPVQQLESSFCTDHAPKQAAERTYALAAQDGGVSPQVAHTLSVLRRVFAQPAAARLLFAGADADSSRLSADAEEVSSMLCCRRVSSSPTCTCLACIGEVLPGRLCPDCWGAASRSW